MKKVTEYMLTKDNDGTLALWEFPLREVVFCGDEWRTNTDGAYAPIMDVDVIKSILGETGMKRVVTGGSTNFRVTKEVEVIP